MADTQNSGDSGDTQLFDEFFTITEFDQTKYDRVARITGYSHDGTTSFTLDINTELFPVEQGESLKLVLASSLSLDGSKDDGRGWKDDGHNPEPTLAEIYDYVCYGKCYKFEDGGDGQIISKAYLSFGGLLMALSGPHKKLIPLRIDNVYLLVSRQ